MVGADDRARSSKSQVPAEVLRTIEETTNLSECYDNKNKKTWRGLPIGHQDNNFLPPVFPRLSEVKSNKWTCFPYKTKALNCHWFDQIAWTGLKTLLVLTIWLCFEVENLPVLHTLWLAEIYFAPVYWVCAICLRWLSVLRVGIN